MRNTIVLAATVLLATVSASASAAPFTFTLDPTVTGLTFTVENQGLAASDLDTGDGTSDTYEILLTLTTTTDYSNVGTEADLLAAFSLDLSDGDLDAVALASEPTGFTWTLLEGYKVTGNAAKCTGAEAGALCVEELASASNNLVLDADDTYEWLFLVDIGELGFADETGLSVGIGTLEVKESGPPSDRSYSYSYKGTRALNGTAEFLELTSPGNGEDPGTVSPVPEPGSLMLLGSGLLLAASRMRRRR